MHMFIQPSKECLPNIVAKGLDGSSDFNAPPNNFPFMRSCLFSFDWREHYARN